MSEAKKDDSDLSALLCDCGTTSLTFKISIGAYNDHFDFIECGGCKKRTRGFWSKGEAIEAWKNQDYWKGA